MASSSGNDSLKVLVVDDDSTCLAIVAALLVKMEFQVVALKNANDAIETLRTQGGFDVIISDVHMPGMNGFELQELVFQQFRIPVVLMSGDCEEGIVRQAMQNGAISFIRKPVSPNDLRGIWQYVIAHKKSKATMQQQVDTGDQDNICIGGSSSGTTRSYSGYDTTSKKKMVWTDQVHFIFLDAISSLGPENATPTNILKAMKNVPGLTRENVASHLQKYRQFLRRNIQDPENRNSGGGGNQPRFGSRKFRRLAKLEEMFAQGGPDAALSSAALGGSSAGGDARTRGGRGGSSEGGQQGVLLSEDDELMFYRGLSRGPIITCPNSHSPPSHEVNAGGTKESSPYPTLTALMQNRWDQYLDSSSNDNANVSAFGNVNVVSGNEDVQVPGEGSFPVNEPSGYVLPGDFDIYEGLLNFIGETVDDGGENISMYGNITAGQDNSGDNQIGNLSNDFLNQVNINQTYTPNQLMGNQYGQNYNSGQWYGYNPWYQPETSQPNYNQQYSSQPQGDDRDDDDDDAFVNFLHGPNPYGGPAGNGEGM